MCARADSDRATIAKTRCPADEEMERPGGLAAMREVYGRAADCVAGRLEHVVADWRKLAW